MKMRHPFISLFSLLIIAFTVSLRKLCLISTRNTRYNEPTPFTTLTQIEGGFL